MVIIRWHIQSSRYSRNSMWQKSTGVNVINSIATSSVPGSISIQSGTNQGNVISRWPTWTLVYTGLTDQRTVSSRLCRRSGATSGCCCLSRANVFVVIVCSGYTYLSTSFETGRTVYSANILFQKQTLRQMYQGYYTSTHNLSLMITTIPEHICDPS